MSDTTNQSSPFEIDEKTGLAVLTRDYLLSRGSCCGNGCRNCPYGDSPASDPSEPIGPSRKVPSKEP